MKKKTPAPRKEIKLDKYQLRQYLLKDIPVCEDMEKSVLSTCLVENDKIEQISRQLKPSWFYCSNNREIFASIRMLSRFGSEINVLTVAKEVQESFGKDVSNEKRNNVSRMAPATPQSRHRAPQPKTGHRCSGL